MTITFVAQASELRYLYILVRSQVWHCSHAVYALLKTIKKAEASYREEGKSLALSQRGT
ncbi:hypothetical protein CES85_0353 [Ochrobactrum quorumnocens]|uniref:Uncharacterized protein n=1 Tax=Ochrobactrum quorumnocens TaxID=271865 RepID=A0A248UJ50_9HYPH|nr:hypothetical protein CES85_0353 [[Ochrobactrum] quorumnocens]